MIFFIVSYFILFLPLMLAVNTSNNTDTKNVTINNSSTAEVSNNIIQIVNKSDYNTTKVIAGGALVTETVSATLPNENHNKLLDLEPEINNIQKTGVKARKGAPQYPQEDLLKLNKTDVEESKVNITTDKVDSPPNNTLVTTTISIVPKKPTILNGDDLNMLKVNNYEEKLVPVGGKTKVGVYNKNPGIVIPIVITILVVPAFAALSYMAVKRGKEAWKNRHYKRMDFLLEGMYND